MIRTDKIQTALFGGVGFRNSTLTGYDIVDATNQGATSGLYFQDGSELITIKNIKDSQENASITNEQFNELLGRMQKSVILDVCNKVINGQSDFISSINLYPFEKSFDATLEHRGKFVGFEIIPPQGQIACKIPFVELTFDGDATFNLYLYNSNLPKSPIKTEEVTTVAGESKVVSTDWIIADDVTYKGGSFYLGYFDNDLGSVKAFKKDHDLASMRIKTPYFKVEPVALGISGTTIDVEDKTYISETYGLNIGLEVYRDYTELIVRNKSIFWNAIQLQMHEKVLNMIKYSTRESGDKRSLVDMMKFADFELYGNREMGIAGVQGKLKNSIDSIKKSLFYQPKIQRGTLL